MRQRIGTSSVDIDSGNCRQSNIGCSLAPGYLVVESQWRDKASLKKGERKVRTYFDEKAKTTGITDKGGDRDEKQNNS